MDAALSRPFGADISRRSFLAGAGGLALAAAWPGGLVRALSAATFKQGAFDVTIVSDGHLVIPTKVIAPSAPAEELAPLLKEEGISGETFQPPTNAVVLKSGNDLILFDTGSGTGFQPSAGKMLANLKAAGFEPTTFTKVVFTHAHPDHAWGTVDAEGKPHFPNATHYVTEGEWNFWMDKDIFTKVPKEVHPFATGAQKHLGGVKDMIKTVKPGEEIVTGLSVVDAAGHTPGHAAYEVTGDGGLIITGDAAPSTLVHFGRPDWAFGYDAIPELSVANRKKLLDRAATD
ncbi:MAG: MBL fold metallo-hydrolase, partial [Parvibaculaceae bacterium]